MKVVHSHRRRRARRLGWMAWAVLATPVAATTAQAAPDGGVFSFATESSAPVATDSARDHVRTVTPSQDVPAARSTASDLGALPVSAAAAFMLAAPLLLRRRRRC